MQSNKFVRRIYPTDSLASKNLTVEYWALASWESVNEFFLEPDLALCDLRHGVSKEMIQSSVWKWMTFLTNLQQGRHKWLSQGKKKKKDSLLRKETLAEKINIKKNLRLKLYQQYNENKPLWQVERETRFNFSHS